MIRSGNIKNYFGENAWEPVYWTAVTQCGAKERASMSMVMNSTWSSMNKGAFKYQLLKKNLYNGVNYVFALLPKLIAFLYLPDELIFHSSFHYFFPLFLSLPFLSCVILSSFFPMYCLRTSCFFLHFSFNLIPVSFVYNFLVWKARHRILSAPTVSLNHLTEISTPLK